MRISNQNTADLYGIGVFFDPADPNLGVQFVLKSRLRVDRLRRSGRDLGSLPDGKHPPTGIICHQLCQVSGPWLEDLHVCVRRRMRTCAFHEPRKHGSVPANPVVLSASQSLSRAHVRRRCCAQVLPRPARWCGAKPPCRGDSSSPPAEDGSVILPVSRLLSMTTAGVWQTAACWNFHQKALTCPG